MLLLKIGVGLVGVLAVAALAIYALGASTPRTHTAEVTRVIAAPPERIAARIRAVADYPNWRGGVAVENVNVTNDATTYVELAEGDRISYRLTEPEAGARFVATITDEKLPFGGAWTISIEPVPEGARVRIREDGVIRDALYRFFARYVFGYTSSIEGYLSRLAEAEGATRVSE
jgi:hypothetical protein